MIGASIRRAHQLSALNGGRAEAILSSAKTVPVSRSPAAHHSRGTSGRHRLRCRGLVHAGSGARYRAQPAREADLRNACVIDELDGVLRPTLYGLMVFGRDPQAHPYTLNLFVQSAAYDGSDQATEVLSAEEAKPRQALKTIPCFG